MKPRTNTKNKVINSLIIINSDYIRIAKICILMLQSQKITFFILQNNWSLAIIFILEVILYQVEQQGINYPLYYKNLSIIKIVVMVLEEFKKQLDNFATRIKTALRLENDQNMIIHNKRIVTNWIQEQTISLRDKKQQEKKNEGLFTGILNLAGMNEAFNKIQNEETALEKVKSIVKGTNINFEPIELDGVQIPKEVKQSLLQLNKSRIPNYYGVVLCPLFEGLYIKSREDFDNCIKTGYLNDLKFISLGSDPNHIIKHQRNLLEQLFNQLFIKENELSVVIKIQVEKENFQKNIELFCFIEDASMSKSIIYKSLSEIQSDENENLYVEAQGKIEVDEMSILKCLLNQVLTIPFQSIVSDYALTVEDNTARIIKTHKIQQNSEISSYIKQHPSLRNPLFYFSNYIKSHEFSISSIKSILPITQFYPNFYQILNILIDFTKKDFTIKSPNGKIKSLLVTSSLFEIIWKLFHEFVILSNWIQEMISPIKQTVTLYEINSKLIPIFNEILKLQKTSFRDYQKMLLNLPIQNYLTMNVSKVSIEQYKDRFLTIGSAQNGAFEGNIFDAIFEKTIKNYNISNINIFDAIYFLNFIAKNHNSVFSEGYIGIHQSWKSKRIWKEIVQLINQQFQHFKYLSIHLDILAFHLDFDIVKYSTHPFESIKNDSENGELFSKIELLMRIVRLKFERKFDQYLSILLEKSFRYGKFKVVQFLIKKGINFKNYQQIFVNKEAMQPENRLNAQKEQSIAFMKNRQPEMFRRYQWQQLINVKLKQQAQNLVAFDTIRRGTLYVDKAIYSHLTSRNVNNSLSRKDYMFSNNRHIGKINIGSSEAYLEITEYPLLRYFYSFFLSKINKNSLMPHFCGFFTKKGNLVHLIESLPNCTNYKKALTTSCEEDLGRRMNQQSISEAFIISMILMPTNILLKNIFISQVKSDQMNLQTNNNLFIIDFHDFYQKNGFQFNAGTANLKVRNSLFTFNQMKNLITSKIMKKYANLGILQIVNNVFKESSSLIRQVNQLKPKNSEIVEEQKQLFSILFQNNFCQSLVERMYKIKRTFDKCLKMKTKITHLQLLQILNPALSYYYNEIIESSNRLIEREKIMLDENFKKSFIITDKLINFLPNAYDTEQARYTFPNHYKKFVFEGPTENLANFYQNILKFDVYTKKINEFKDYSHNVIEYFIKNVDLSLYDREERENIINKIQEYSRQYLKKQQKCLPLSIIRYNNLEELKEKNISFSDERLKQLIFEETSSTEGEFNTLLRRYQNMRTLTIRQMSAVQKIGDSFIAVSDTYDFKNLKYLSIVGCRDLGNVDLKCEQLEQASFRKNPVLTQIYLYSRKLKNMDCYQCPKLRLENIGIYILKKVNILLSQNSCDGQVARLQDKNYSIFLTRILRYLFNCFEESNSYKLELIMTLIKLELIDEKLLGFKHNQIYNKNLVHIIAKLGPDILDLVLSQIFDIFLKNDLVDVLNLDQLLKIDVKLLAIIENYFVKMIKMKEEAKCTSRRTFSSLIFKDFSRNNQNYNEIFNFIKTLINLIDADKIVQFELSLSKDIFIQDYSQLINLLNKKSGLEKIELKIQNSIIKNQFMEYLFTLDGPRNRIYRIQFIHCQLKVDNQILIAMFPFIKSLIFNSCRIATLDFIENFTSLTNLEFHSCKFDNEVYEIYAIIGKLKSLLNLSLINFKNHLKDSQLFLSRLFENLLKLHKLQLFDFSDNELNKQELTFFSEQLHKIKIYQLNLYNFHEDNLNEYIDFFLYNENIKIITIQFKIRNIKLFESFIDTLSNNNSIVKINLKTDQSIESNYFLKIKNNCKIQSIQSNHPIPNWVKNHFNNNIINKSVSAILDEDTYEPDMSSREKNEDYCRIGLSLDGGGARGLLLATSMDYISRKVGQPLHKIFDYIGGTSIGGVLALASTGTLDGYHPICNTQQLMDIFEIYGDSIFKKTQFGNIVSIFETKYDIKSYQGMLDGYFKETKLSDVLKQTNVVVNAVNRYTNQDVIFRSINSIFDRNQDFYMKDISRATSAAPTYFPSAEIKNVNANLSYSLIDGGVGLNNPSKLVIDDIIKITQNQAHKKNYFLLSLGTGRLRNEAVPTNAGIKDLAPIIDSLTESANYFIEKDLSQNYRGHYLRVSPYINLSRKDSELDNTTPETYSAYKKFALEAAQENYSHTIAFGKFKNQSFIEWLQENTDRKHQTK